MNRLSRRQLARIAAVTGAIAAPALILPKWHDARAGLVRADAGDLAKLDAMLAGHFGFGMIGGRTAVASTLNPADKGPGITLSNGNLTAAWASSVDNGWVRATNSKAPASSKLYLEFKVNSLTQGVSYEFGLISGSKSLTSDNALTASAGAAYQDSGFIRYNGTTDSGATLAVNSVLGIALDANQIWFSKNGVWQNKTPNVDAGYTFNPGVNVYPAIWGSTNSNGDLTVTINFGATAFAYTPPSGFSAWG